MEEPDTQAEFSELFLAEVVNKSGGKLWCGIGWRLNKQIGEFQRRQPLWGESVVGEAVVDEFCAFFGEPRLTGEGKPDVASIAAVGDAGVA